MSIKHGGIWVARGNAPYATSWRTPQSQTTYTPPRSTFLPLSAELSDVAPSVVSIHGAAMAEQELPRQRTAAAYASGTRF